MGQRQPAESRKFAVINIRTNLANTSSNNYRSDYTISNYIPRDPTAATVQYANSLSTLNTERTMVSNRQSQQPPVRAAPVINAVSSNWRTRSSNPFDITRPSARSTPTIMVVLYASENRWKRISFPPNVTVAQARDLCMLRFSVWQHLVGREAAIAQSVHSHSSSSSASHTDKDTESVGNFSNKSDESSREQFGLYWVAQETWLENSRLLSSYTFGKADVLELQDRDNFVTLQTHTSSHESPGAEGMIYHLHGKGMTTAWKLRYMVLRNQTLYLCRKRSDDISKAHLEVDLTQMFRIIDQNGQSNHEISTSDRLSDDSSSKSIDSAGTSSFSAILGLASAHGRYMGGDGAPLIVQSGKDVHVFCTKNAVDYDYWRRALRLAQEACADKLSHNASKSTSKESSRNSSVPSASKRIGKRRAARITMSVASATTVSSSSLASSAQRQNTKDGDKNDGVARAERFVATAYRKRASTGLQLCHCAVTLQYLYGFSSQDPAEIPDEQLAALADFSIELDPSTVFVAAEVHNDRFVLRLFDVAELLWLEVGTETKRNQWLDALFRIGGITQTDYFDLESICTDSYSSIDQDMQAISLRRSRSFVSTISRAEWPIPPSALPISSENDVAPQALSSSFNSRGPLLRNRWPKDKRILAHAPGVAQEEATLSGSKPSLDAVGGRTEEPEGLLARFPQWFKRRSSISN